MRKNSFQNTMLVLLVFSLCGTAMAAPKVPVTNTQCPVMKNERTKEKFFVDYKGQHINFCCKSCIKRFNKDPEKYLARLHPAQ